jgi:hypothetical protein
MLSRSALAYGISLAFVATSLAAQKPQSSPGYSLEQRVALALPDRDFDRQCEAESIAWRQFVEQNGGQWISQWNRASGTPSAIWGSGLRLNDWRGNTQEEARRQANNLLAQQSDLLGTGQSEFREAIASRIGSNWSFVFDQYYQGLQVEGGRADVRVHMTGKVSMFGSMAFAIPAGFSTVPAVDELTATWTAWQALGLAPQVRQPNDKRAPRLVIAADAMAAKQQPVVLAWEIPVSAVDAEGKGPIGRYLVDAQTGRIVRYENDKHECGDASCATLPRGFERASGDESQPTAALPVVTGTVRGWTRMGTGATSTLQNIPLAGVEINVPGAGVVVTDANGNFSANVNVATNVSVTLDGIHSQAVGGAGSPTVNATLTPGVPANIQFFSSAATPEDAAHTSTYHWTYAVNEFLRSLLGNSPELAAADNVAATVNIASTCNAYYTGNTINFYATGGSCNNTAFSSVVAHEWGHGIDDRYGGISQTNGLSEAWGDITSEYLLDFPTVGENFFTNGGFIRTGTNTRQYPTGTGVHAQGESFMGFAWKLRERLATTLGSRPAAIALTNDIVLATLAADSTNQRDAVREVFLADDNDGNLTNGTPNSADLLWACQQHNLPDPSQPGPANDDCAGAIAVAAGLNGPFDTSLSTTSSPSWPCAGGGSDLWYRYTALGTGQMTVDTCTGTNYDSALEVFSGACGALTSLACNDDTCGLSSSVTVNVSAGQTYYIRVGGYGGAAGAFQLNISAPAGGVPASLSSYGTGCYSQSRSFYESFATASAIDLNNTTMTLVRTGNAYIALPIGSYVAPSGTATSLTLGDDAITTVALSGSFPYSGGTTTSLEVCSNGFVSVATGNGATFSPTAAAWLNSAQARWGTWHDYYPGTVGFVKFEEIAGVAYVTWDNVRDFTGTGTNTWQLQFDLASGNVTFAWQTMSGAGNAYLVGYAAAGGASTDLGSTDISVRLPAGGFSTGTSDSNGLSQTSDLPRINQLMNVTTTNYATGSSLGFVCFGVVGFNPGVEMSQFGAPNCYIHVNTDFNFLVVATNGTSVLPLQIPNDPGFQGAVLNTQTFALAPGANQLGITASNGIALTFGY